MKCLGGSERKSVGSERKSVWSENICWNLFKNFIFEVIFLATKKIINIPLKSLKWQKKLPSNPLEWGGKKKKNFETSKMKKIPWN